MKLILRTAICYFLAALFADGILPSSTQAEPTRGYKKYTDYDGDNLGDLILYDPTTGSFTIRKSSDSEISTIEIGGPGDAPSIGDYNGDGRADLSTYNRTTRSWTRKIKNGAPVSLTLGNVGDIPVPMFYDDSSCTNHATFNRRTSLWSISSCDGDDEARTVTFGGTGNIPVPADFDCDGRDDLATYRRSDGRWSIRKSSTGTVINYKFGLKGDIPVPGPWKGNGCAQAALYRPSDSTFYVAETLKKSKTRADISFSVQWGLLGDIPLFTNADADNKLDYSIYRYSNNTVFLKTSLDVLFQIPFPTALQKLRYWPFNIKDAASNEELTVIPEIAALSIPRAASGAYLKQSRVQGDYDGNGSSDFVVTKIDRTLGTTSWNIRHGDETSSSYVLGAPADAYAHADYNGDGITQPGLVYVNPARTEDGRTPLEWHWRKPDGNINLTLFGRNGDQPIVGDFDGDGKDDISVVRIINGFRYWYFKLATTKRISDYVFGTEDDRVIGAADVNGDGADELVLARINEDDGKVTWLWKKMDGVNDGLVDGSAEWGLSSYKLLPPYDLDGDGADDLIYARSSGNIVTHYVRYKDGSTQEIPFGLSGDIPTYGHYSGSNIGELGVYRRGGVSNFYYLQGGFLTQNVVFGVSSNDLARPDGTAVLSSEGGIGGSGGGGTIAPGCIPAPGTDNDFKDGANGSLWKPVSETTPNHAPAMLFPASYVGSNIAILSSSGAVVSGIQKRSCCPNGNRAHFWASKSAEELVPYAPITVKVIRPDNVTECRVVVDPTQRID